MLKLFLETGQIVGTHGIRGELRVNPWSDSPNFLTEFKEFYLDDKGQKKLNVLSVKPHGRIVIMAVEGVESIEAAEHLRGKVLYISRNDIHLEEDRYLVQDLIGCKVYDVDSKEYIGELSNVSETGANDVWHIIKDSKEYLIPAIPDVLIDVDVKNERIEIRPLKGIFDDED
ncbi:MAG: ribosome maturation factor RimM [Oscillospiraceae bacterium]|nr:ribosome maturation factor RimM [Oscillospiraceae bacterium]